MILMPVTVLLVDDQKMFREALHLLLAREPSIKILGEAGRGEDALRFCMKEMPMVILMDLHMPGMGGVETTRRLLEQHPNARILVLTALHQEEEVFAALRAGASGYILKTSSARQLVEAIQVVATGQSYLQPSVASVVVAGIGRQQVRAGWAAESAPRSLSSRERCIVHLLSEGRSNREIAMELDLAEGTVKNHVAHILGKLEVPDRNAAAARARMLNL
jgi:DNA-binding NarL/FixJ family response regulator